MCSKVLLALVAALAITSVANAQPNDLGGAGGTGRITTFDGLIDFFSTKNGTELVWGAIEQLIESGVDPELVAALNDTATVATVFAPLDEDVQALLTASPDALADPAALAEILRYHVVPGTSYKLDQLTDGLWLQTLVEGEKGKLLVQKGPNQQKPTLLTTSGQKVPIYQFNLETASGAQLFTIRGVLVPGDIVLQYNGTNTQA